MHRLRALCGGAALFALVIALNLVAIRRDAFNAAVLAPLAVAAVLGVVWAVLAFVARAAAQGEPERKSNLSGIVGSLAFLGICVVLYAFFQRWDRTWDLTEEGRTEMAPQTVQVLQGLTQDVNVYALFTTALTSEQRELEIARDRARLFLERCAKLSPHLKVEFLDPQKDAALMMARGITYADPKGSVVIKSGPRMRTITLGGNKAQPRLEERDFTNTLINIVQESQPKIGFTTGHGELDISKPGLAMVKELLAREGYKAEPMMIRADESGIAGDYDLVIMNGLNAQEGGDLTPEEIAALDQYVLNGGRILLLADPQFALDPLAGRKRVLEWVQHRFGIVVGEDLIISPIDNRLGEVTLLPDAQANSVFQQVDVPDVEFNGCFDQDSPITRNFDKMMLFLAARSVRLEEPLPEKTTAQIILRTLPYCWGETNIAAMRQGHKPARDPQEELGSIGIAAAAVLSTDQPIGDSGQMKTARAVVIGDTEFILDQNIRNGGHINFFMNTIAWLTEREQLIAIRPVAKENQPINLTPADETAIAWLSGMGIVQVVLAFGLLMYAVRRRYR